MATIESNFESICINPNDDLVLYNKEIIRSRIEKFLYAICSLDTDDLPTPLSRIEELYNCLVTGGDIPTFTPLSRAEKFVMAMLGAYDVELLPTPISRSETLMKKIAIGDNNLDDIDNLQSRYEFLLAYIIKAGGFNGGSGDFYYNLTSLTSSFTTIYGTLDKPVKNAVLRGSTLVNLVGTYKHTISTVNKPIVWGQKRLFLTNIKPNTRYTLRVKMTEVVKGNYGPRVQIFFTTYSTGEINTTTSDSDTLIFTSPAELSSDAHLRLIVTGSEAEATEVDFEILLLEGEHPDIKDIPYFDYMQSVKMPVLKTVGKNLCDEVFELGTLTDGVDIDNPLNKYTRRSVNYYDIKGAQTLTLSGTIRMFGDTTAIIFYNLNKEYISTVELVGTGGTTSVPKNAHFAKIRFGDTNTTLNVQLEESSVATEYEPHKSTTVSCNEEVELRGISNGSNRFEDELNLVTGELTQRVGEIVLDGNESWGLYGSQSSQVNTVAFKLSNTNHISSWGTGLGYCDKLLFTNGDVVYGQDLEGVTTDANNIIVRVNKSKASSVDEFKSWLLNNNIRVIYPLKENVIKTVDLSALDQDGKKTKLNTFDDITHVITSSEGLVPTGEIDIARPIQFVDYSLDNSLTTLYNTLEYPVKSAILNGNTLVNLINSDDIQVAGGSLTEYDGTYVTITVTANATTYMTFSSSNVSDFKPNTKYFIRCEVLQNNLSSSFNPSVGHSKSIFDLSETLKVNTSYKPQETGTKFAISTTKSDFTGVTGALRGACGSMDMPVVVGESITFRLMFIEYQEGMEHWDIPYFEGMTSVKMPVLTTTGKNLFDIDKINTNYRKNNDNTEVTVENNKLTIVSKNNGRSFIHQLEPLYLKPNTEYTFSITGSSTGDYRRVHLGTKSLVDNNQYKTILFSEVEETKNVTFITDDTGYLFIHFYPSTSSIATSIFYNIQLEEGSTATSYEPYKSNILTCNEEVELCGIGDIKDELNLMTGELTQHVGAITIDDSHGWRVNEGMNGEQETHLVFQSEYKFSDYKYVASNLNIASNKFSLVGFGGNAGKAGEWLTIGSNSLLYVKINKNKLDTHDINGFKKWLLQNPITIQYELTTKSVKTVDLSISDQDDVLLISENGEYIITENGNYINVITKSKKTKLKTFDDITHVIVSSEGLVPTGEITVATKNATDVADASVMSLRMDDILNSQETLEGSANTQSDDIDATMLGATDIYEQLL